MTPDGEAPYWHQIEDTFDKMDLDVMARSYDMAMTLIREIDAKVGQ